MLYTNEDQTLKLFTMGFDRPQTKVDENDPRLTRFAYSIGELIHFLPFSYKREPLTISYRDFKWHVGYEEVDMLSIDKELVNALVSLNIRVHTDKKR